jgi:hypothetical protein
MHRNVSSQNMRTFPARNRPKPSRAKAEEAARSRERPAVIHDVPDFSQHSSKKYIVGQFGKEGVQAMRKKQPDVEGRIRQATTAFLESLADELS